MEFKDFIKVQWQACGEKLSLEAFICSFIHICVIKWKLKNKKKVLEIRFIYFLELQQVSYFG